MSRLSTFHQEKARKAGIRELSSRDALRPKFMYRNSNIPGVTDVFTQKLRDYYAVVAGTAVTAQILYTIPVGGQYTPAGGTAFTKTRFHTNLTQAGQLAAPRRFLIKGMSAIVNHNIAPSDINNMLFQTLVQLYVDEKRYWESQLTAVPGGGGPAGSVNVIQATNANTNYSTLSNGYQESKSILTFEGDGLWISTLQNFSVVLDPTLVDGGAFTPVAASGTTFGQGVKIQYALEGLLSGPVM